MRERAVVRPPVRYALHAADAGGGARDARCARLVLASTETADAAPLGQGGGALFDIAETGRLMALLICLLVLSACAGETTGSLEGTDAFVRKQLDRRGL